MQAPDSLIQKAFNTWQKLSLLTQWQPFKSNLSKQEANMSGGNFSQVAAFIWSVADLLRGDFKQSQYGRIILPFTLLRRLECVLEPSKDAVLAQAQKLEAQNLPEETQEKFLLRATNGLSFFNTSKLDLSTLGQENIRLNLNSYVQNFSKEAREIFEHFKFEEFVSQLDEANLLYKVVQKFAQTDLSPQAISNHEMGLVFEELIRKFAESSNETAGEHFTPRDIVRLTTALVFTHDDDVLSKEGIIRTVYDPTAGTGGFLSSGMEYLHEVNPSAVMRAFGQELNPESYAICKGDMLIKGLDVKQIKLGNTLSNDQLAQEQFDYMLSNPPVGVDWKKIEGDIKTESEQKGFAGRFGPGLPRVSDGSLLFLLHLISKMRDVNPSDNQHGSRIGIILNGSPLFTGGAGSGESEIRRYILQQDLLEAIVALPTDMFYNTGIATYIWILSNNKAPERKGKVHLINAANLGSKMRKSLGSKRNELSETDMALIVKNFGEFVAQESQGNASLSSKIFDTHQFGYRRVTIERPLRLSAQITDEAIATLAFAPKPFNQAMQRLQEAFALVVNDDLTSILKAQEAEIRALIKAEFADIKEKDIKTLLCSDIWFKQQQLQQIAKQLQAALGSEQSDDFNVFESQFNSEIKHLGLKLDAKDKKQLLDAFTWKNPEAEPVIQKVVKGAANPLYGRFDYQGKVVEFVQDGDLRDAENIALNPSIDTSDLIESYFKVEVQPHVQDAWINSDKRDEQDGEIGLVGYEIPFNRHFYVYEPPRSLAEIDADLDAVSRDIMALLQEVHS